MFKIFEIIRNKIAPPTYNVTSIDDRLIDKNFFEMKKLSSKLSANAIKKRTYKNSEQ